MFALLRLHAYLHILYISVVPNVSDMYTHTVYIEEEKEKLRYFDHTCRSGILYTVLCITFLSRASVVRLHTLPAHETP